MGHYAYSRKVGARNAQAISKIFVAAFAQLNGNIIEDIRLAAGSVGPVPLRLSRTEAALTGLSIHSPLSPIVEQSLAEEIRPIDDLRSTARYRTTVLRNLIMEFLDSLALTGFSS